MMKRVLWGERKAVAMVGNRLLCLTTIPMSNIMSNSHCANQLCPSYKFLSTKTPPLLQEDGGSKLGLEGAMGLFKSFILKDPRPSVPEFDKLLEAILSSHQFSFKSRSTIVIALSKVMTSLEIQPSLLTLNMLLECYSSGVGRLDLGFSIFATIIKLYPDPDGAIHTTLPTGMMTEAHTLLQHMISNKKLGLSQILPERMIKDGQTPAPGTYQHELATDVYSFILNGMCKAGKPSEAMQLFHSLMASGVEPNAKMYNLMVAALCNKDEDMWYHTTGLLLDMGRKNFELDYSILSTLLEDCYTRLIKSKGLADFLLEKIGGGFVPIEDTSEENISLIRKYLSCKDSIDIYVWNLDRNYRLPIWLQDVLAT